MTEAGNSRCPKCKHENTRGTDAHGWATCCQCGFLWRVATAPSAPSPPAAGAGLAAQRKPVRSGHGPGSDEYLPDEATDHALRALSTARLTAAEERQPISVVGSDELRSTAQDGISSAGGVAADEQPAPTDASADVEPGSVAPFDAPEVADPRSVLPDIAMPGAQRVGTAEPSRSPSAIADGKVSCPICGHRSPVAGLVGDIAMCPQCHSRFDVGDGSLVAAGEEGGGAAAFDTDDDAAIIGSVIGGCAVDRKIGEGGMGTVFHGRQLSLDRDVAVKILAPELTVQSHFMHRFTQEARSLAQINHPNILHVYDFGEDSAANLYYMIMEFIDGEDLADLLHRRRQITEIECLDIIYQAANGLRAAAAKGIIHRDIKPDNLMLTTGDRVVKVTDFGLAKNAATITQTNAKIRVGTPAFMSPEQCDGHRLDARSDMYSLGCTAFVALTGRLPFEGETPFSIMLKHKADPVPRVRELVPAVDAELDRMIARLMAKEREDRWDDWEGVIDLARRLLDRHGGPTMTYSKSEAAIPALVEESDPSPRSVPAAPPSASPVPASVAELTLGEVAPKSASATLDRAPPVAARSASETGVTAQSPPSSARPAVAERGKTPVIPSSASMPAARRRGQGSDIFPDDDDSSDDGSESHRSTARHAGSARLRIDSEVLVRNRIGTLQERSGRIQGNMLEGDRLAARGRWGKAIRRWEAVVQDIGDLRARDLCYQKIAQARIARSRQRRRRSLVFTVIMLPVLWYGLRLAVPSAHNLWADLTFDRIAAEEDPAALGRALDDFLGNLGRPLPWYETVWFARYEVTAAARAEALLHSLDQVAGLKEARSQETQALEELEAWIGDPTVSWFAIESRFHQVRDQLTTPALRRRLEGVVAAIEPPLAAIRLSFDAIETALAQGRFSDACVLASSLEEQHPRAGAVLDRLPRLLVVEAVDNRGDRLDDLEITVDEVPSVDQPPTAYQIRATPVEVVISRPGYLSHRLVVPAQEDMEPRLRIALQPGRAWEQLVADDGSPWYELYAVGEQVVLLSAHTLTRLDLGRGTVLGRVRRDALEGRLNATLRWSRSLEVEKSGALLLGSMDGGVWEWPADGERPQRLYQSTLPVRSAIRFPLGTASSNTGMAVALDGVRGAMVEGLADGQRRWRETIGTLRQSPIMFHRTGLIYILGDDRLFVFDEQGVRRGILSLDQRRTGAVRWLRDDVLLVPTLGGLSTIRIWPEGDATIAQALVLAESRITGLAVSRGFGVALIDHAICAAYQQDQDGVLLREQWRIAAPEGSSWALAPVADHRYVVLVDESGRITVHDSRDGSLLRRYDHAVPLRCPPLLLARHIVIYDRDDQVIAYHLPE